MTEPRKLDRHDVLAALAQAFTFFVILKIADWVLGAGIVDVLGPTKGIPAHALLFALLALAWAGRGIYRLRDRFSVIVGALTLLVPLVAYFATRA